VLLGLVEARVDQAVASGDLAEEVLLVEDEVVRAMLPQAELDDRLVSKTLGDKRQLAAVARAAARQEVCPGVGEEREELLGQVVIDLHVIGAHPEPAVGALAVGHREERAADRTHTVLVLLQVVPERPDAAARVAQVIVAAAVRLQSLRRLGREARRRRPPQELPHRSMSLSASSEGRRGSVGGIDGTMRWYSVSAPAFRAGSLVPR
jgi:hypothetical protein